MTSITETSLLLRKAGINPSAQRIAVMQYLMATKSHPTVADIYEALLPEHPTLSRTTIYNTLKLFVENGCALSLDIDSANARYDATTNPHAHFFCRRCHRVTDIAMTLPQLDTDVYKDYKCDDVALFYTGVCPECRHNKQDNLLTTKIIRN